MLFVKIEALKTPIGKGLQAIDWIGNLAIIGGTIILLLCLNFGNVSFPWNSATVICTVLFGYLLLVAFLVIESWVPKHPITSLHIFNSTSNIACSLTGFSQSLVFISGTYFFPVYFQDTLLAPPLLSSVYLLPFVISLAVSAATSGILIRKTGHYRTFI